MGDLGLRADQQAVGTNTAQGHIGLGIGRLLDAVNNQDQLSGNQRATIWASPNAGALAQEIDLFARDDAIEFGGRTIAQGNGHIRRARAFERLVKAIGQGQEAEQHRHHKGDGANRGQGHPKALGDGPHIHGDHRAGLIEQTHD